MPLLLLPTKCIFKKCMSVYGTDKYLFGVSFSDTTSFKNCVSTHIYDYCSWISFRQRMCKGVFRSQYQFRNRFHISFWLKIYFQKILVQDWTPTHSFTIQSDRYYKTENANNILMEEELMNVSEWTQTHSIYQLYNIL